VSERLFLDTDVLIDYLRGNSNAIAYLENQSAQLQIAAITVAELYAGVRDGKERVKLDAFVSAFEIIPTTKEIALQGGLYRRDYGKSHGTGLADALIAATAEFTQVPFVTMNRKHFPMLPNVITPYQRN